MKYSVFHFHMIENSSKVFHIHQKYRAGQVR